ncbi:MAG TPA: type II toxin-antitoxin system VapC family toxin [Chloroflexia bacterium]|jgi:predicted nucleic acid-binding protein
MSKLVVDSSVAIKWFVDEDDSDQAQMLLDQIGAGDYTLIVPELIYAEVGNIIWKKVMRGLLAPSDGQIVADTFFAAGIESEVVLTRTLFLDACSLAINYKQSMYDAIYLALSIQEQCPVVTADERLFNSVGASLPNLVLLANWS